MNTQNPKYPDKLYNGLSVDDFIKQYPLTNAQIDTLKQLRSEGKLY